MLAPSMRRVVATFAPRLQACSSRPMVSEIRCDLIRATMMTPECIPVLAGHPLEYQQLPCPLQSQLHVSAAGQQATTLPPSLKKIVGLFQMVPDPMARWVSHIWDGVQLWLAPWQGGSAGVRVRLAARPHGKVGRPLGCGRPHATSPAAM